MPRIVSWIVALILLPLTTFALPHKLQIPTHLLIMPAGWGILTALLFPNTFSWHRIRSDLLGKRRFWPFVWMAALFALSMSFIGIGYSQNLVTFSYGATRPQAIAPWLLPWFLALCLVWTLGVEFPLRKKLLGEILLSRGIGTIPATALCALLGVWNSLPFYWIGCLEKRYFFFALLLIFIRECTLCRLYIVSTNLLACGAYQAFILVLQAFMISDVLSPYLPAFHWVSSSSNFYLGMILFSTLPFIVLSFVRPAR